MSNDGLSHPTGVQSGDYIYKVLEIWQLARCAYVSTNSQDYTEKPYNWNDDTAELEVWVVESIWNKLVIASAIIHFAAGLNLTNVGLR